MEVDEYLAQGNGDLKKNKWDNTKDGSSAGCFDCNICLDSTREPVVTLCGHLYCWPCIYKWLNHDPNPSNSNSPQPCPVCKSPITPTALIPLYGRGGFDSKAALSDIDVPKRPAPTLAEAPAAPPAADTAINNDLLSYDSLHHSQQQYYQYRHYNQYLHSAGGASEMNFSGMGRFVNPNSTALAGGMAYKLLPWVFGLVFGCPQSLVNDSDPHDLRRSYDERWLAVHHRLRPERQAEISLNRVSVFLLCCLVLCLLLF